MKRFEYSPLGKELKVKTGIVKNQYKNQTILMSLVKKFKKKNEHLKTAIIQI